MMIEALRAFVTEAAMLARLKRARIAEWAVMDESLLLRRHI
jgi:hypothetical protein